MAGSVQLLCLATSSGVPLFCRSKGESRQLPFSVIGSLNGVHMFGSNQDVLLTSTCTDNTRVCWRVFRDSITLIVMSSEEDASDLYLSRLLDNVFSAMVLVIGLDDLVNLKNVERLKRELRACYKLIDSLLAASDWMGDLTLCVDCVVSPDAAVLQEALEVFVAAAESNFGCLMVMGKVVVATEKWWRLAAQEVVLLAWLVGSLAPSSSRDYPIYLPHGSPTVPHRLLTFQLVPGVDVCLLCGPTPSLQQVQSELVERFWSPLLEPLKNCFRLHHCSIPACGPLHHSIVGLLLINREQNKNLFTLEPHGVENAQQHAEAGQAKHGESRIGRCRESQRSDGHGAKGLSHQRRQGHRGDRNGTKVVTGGGQKRKTTEQGAILPPERWRSVLRQFYTLAVSAYFPADTTEDKPVLHEEFHAGFSHSPSECYIVAEHHKCYGIQTQQYQLFLTFTADTPTFALRNIATKTLNLLTKEVPF